MMKIAITICCLLLLAPACATTTTVVEPKPEILGVRLGMTREEAHARLRNIGQLEKEERRQQEVWRLTGDPGYTHLMVAFNKEYTAVRYITAVANEQGSRIRYADVINVGKARLESTQATHTYTQDVAARSTQPGFVTKAIGTDPTYLKYYSIERAE
jgi:hypothetical protein